MRFVDASVFVHAYIDPERELKPHESKLKKNAKKIVERINEGEEVTTSVVHFSEIVNILESFFSLKEALRLELTFLGRSNINLVRVSEGDYFKAIGRAMDLQMGLNDVLASLLMEKGEISEIYSFDHDFDEMENVKRVTE